MTRKIRIPTPAEMGLLRQRVLEIRISIEETANRLRIIKNDELPSTHNQFNQISATLRKNAGANIEKGLISERERLSTKINALKKERFRLEQSVPVRLALNNVLTLELDISEANVVMSGGNTSTPTSCK